MLQLSGTRSIPEWEPDSLAYDQLLPEPSRAASPSPSCDWMNWVAEWPPGNRYATGSRENPMTMMVTAATPAAASKPTRGTRPEGLVDVNRGRQADGDCGDQPQRHAAAAGDQSTLAGPKGELACNAGEEDRQQKDEQVPGAHRPLAAVPGGDAEPDDRQHDAHTGEPVRRPDEVLAHAPEVHEGVSRELDRVVEVDEGIPGGAEPILNNPKSWAWFSAARRATQVASCTVTATRRSVKSNLGWRTMITPATATAISPKPLQKASTAAAPIQARPVHQRHLIWVRRGMISARASTIRMSIVYVLTRPE